MFPIICGQRPHNIEYIIQLYRRSALADREYIWCAFLEKARQKHHNHMSYSPCCALYVLIVLLTDSVGVNQ
jgi:hypothetical protein